MTNNTTNNVQAAQTKEELMNVLFTTASVLKTQLIASPILADPSLQNLHNRISKIADELLELLALI